MSDKTLGSRIKHKVDTAANWVSNNPVLLAGEIGFESNTRQMKLGDGSTAWNSLPYAGSSGGSLAIATQAEMEAGTNNTKMATPLGVKQAIDYNRPTITYY